MQLQINWIKQKYLGQIKKYDDCSLFKGYPGKYEKIKIVNIDKIKISKSDYVYHAGTKLFKNEIRSNGGRVLNITSTGNNYSQIRKKIISNIKKLNWKNGFYRKDIGWKIIDKNANY